MQRAHCCALRQGFRTILQQQRQALQGLINTHQVFIHTTLRKNTHPVFASIPAFDKDFHTSQHLANPNTLHIAQQTQTSVVVWCLPHLLNVTPSHLLKQSLADVELDGGKPVADCCSVRQYQVHKPTRLLHHGPHDCISGGELIHKAPAQ